MKIRLVRLHSGVWWFVYTFCWSVMCSAMYNCPVYADGSICLDILQNQWSPIYDIAAILTSI
ncbi:hypothetical protein ACSBR2_000791 [Camellia fascicularis]